MTESTVTTNTSNALPTEAPKAVEDIPLAEITELTKTYEEVLIRLCRRNERGQVATVYNGIKIRTEDLVKVDDWVREMAGGGRYRCEVKDPTNPARYAMSPFWFSVEGPPRPPRWLGAPEAPMPTNLAGAPAVSNYQPPPNQTYYPQAPQQQPGGYAPPPSPWAQNLPPQERAGYQPTPYYAARPLAVQPELPPGATHASDALALRQVADLKAELAQMRAESKAMTERLSAENDRLKADLAQKERQVEAERHNAQLAALNAKLEALSSRPQEVAPKTDLKDYAALAAAVAPVLTAFVSSSSSASAKSLEVQAQGLQNLMQATLSQANKTGDLEKLLTTIGPLIMPLIGDMMKARSPESQAGLFQAMAENNLNSVAMMAQLIEAFASAGGKEEPWYLPMIKEALGGVVQVAQAYTQQPGGLPGQLPAPPTPSGALASYATLEDRPQVVQAPPSARDATPKGPPASPKEAAKAPVPAGLEMLFSMLPADYQTPEWRAILRSVHAEPPMAAEQASAMLASHLEHLLNFDMLPPGLTTLRSHPRQTLEALLEKLPVARSNPRYAMEVLDKTMTFLAADGFVDAPEAPQVDDDPAGADEVEVVAQAG